MSAVAKNDFRASHHEHFGREIGEIALNVEFGGQAGGPCPVGEWMNQNKAEGDDENYSCAKGTCPVCNFCFKWHHPKGRHGTEDDL